MEIKTKLKIIYVFAGTSFAEALGMCTMPPPRKRGNVSSSSVTKLIKTEPGTSTSKIVTPPITIKTEPLNINSNVRN